jgi:hypothetical protein
VKAVQRVLDRVSGSEAPEVLRIAPVWAKNLESARRYLTQIEKDRTRFFADIDACREVSGKYFLLTASFVEISADDAPGADSDDVGSDTEPNCTRVSLMSKATQGKHTRSHELGEHRKLS